jgi:hypothetical protein
MQAHPNPKKWEEERARAAIVQRLKAVDKHAEEAATLRQVGSIAASIAEWKKVSVSSRRAASPRRTQNARRYTP